MPPRDWRPFEDARTFARSLRLLGSVEWMCFASGAMAHLKGLRPPDIPSIPSRCYSGVGWKGLRDWLGPPPVKPVEPGYLDFGRARAYARALRLASVLQWRAWCDGLHPELPRRPRTVPGDPPAIYPDAWRGWNDWLGAVSAAPVGRWRGFVAAREFARSLRLSGNREWRLFCRGRRPDAGGLPDDIPARPHVIYCFRGFIGYGDWLGTDVIGSRVRPRIHYEEASEYVVSLGITTEPDFLDWVAGRRPDLPPKPIGLPTNPNRDYAGRGWTTWGQFLRTDSVWQSLRRYRGFPEARAFARALHLRNLARWYEWCRGERSDLPSRPGDIPVNAREVYLESGWTNWGDFLGTGNVRRGTQTYRPFEEAREFARGLGLRSVEEFRTYLKGGRPDLPAWPSDIPAAPEHVYTGQGGWNGWPDFLGKRRDWHRHLPFAKARQLARKSGFPDKAAYLAWIHGERPDLAAPPPTIPATPEKVYTRAGWKGWGDYLGTGRFADGDRVFRPFAEAREFVRSLGLRNWPQWEAWANGFRPDLPLRPLDIPCKPDLDYRDSGFTTWADFLGVAETARLGVRRRPPAGRDAPPGPRGLP